MKKAGASEFIIAGVMIVIILITPFILNNITGKAVKGPGGPPEGVSSEDAGGFGGPSSEDISCMMSCMGCSSPGVGCTGNQEQCMTQCSVEPEPEPASEGESCMQDCIKVGCGEFDFDCQEKNK